MKMTYLTFLPQGSKKAFQSMQAVCSLLGGFSTCVVFGINIPNEICVDTLVTYGQFAIISNDAIFFLSVTRSSDFCSDLMLFRSKNNCKPFLKKFWGLGWLTLSVAGQFLKINDLSTFFEYRNTLFLLISTVQEIYTNFRAFKTSSFILTYILDNFSFRILASTVNAKRVKIKSLTNVYVICCECFESRAIFMPIMFR